MSEYPAPARTETVRLTVAQAVVRFLAQQHTERDGQRQHVWEWRGRAHGAVWCGVV